MRALPHLLLALLSPLTACGLDGPEGMFVQLFGRVTTEYGDPAGGVEVSIASASGAAVLETTTNNKGWYSAAVLFTELEGHEFLVQLEGGGYAPTLAWIDLTLVDGESMAMPSHPPQLWSAWNRQLPPLQVAYAASAGSAAGVLLDASTGEPPVEDPGGQETPVELDLDLRLGWNAPDSEPVVATTTTGLGPMAGRWVISGIEPGLYTARVHGSAGFTSVRFPVLMRAETEQEIRATVTEALASDEIRASLVWGATPADLDLHVTGPRGSVAPGESQYERFHVYSQDPYHPSNASDVHDRVVTMDLLAEDGEGPESLTVHELRSAGAYRFTVFNRTDDTINSSEALSDSGALVQLWIGIREPRFFEVTPGMEGNLWPVAEWDSDTDIVYRFAELGSTDDESDIEAF